MKINRRAFFGLLAVAPVVVIAATKRKTTGGLFDPHDDLAGQYKKHWIKASQHDARWMSARFNENNRIPIKYMKRLGSLS